MTTLYVRESDGTYVPAQRGDIIDAATSLLPPKISSVPEAEAMAMKKLAGQPIESVVALYCDQANHVIGHEVISSGTPDQSAVYPRVIIRGCILANATGVIMAHNHPAGTCQPSSSDREMTRAMAAALKAVDLRFLDHLIVTPIGTYFSFREAGLI